MSRRPSRPAAARSERPPVHVVHGVEALTSAHGRLFVVVGVFDGLHRGHLYLIRELRREAARHRARPAVITFDSHPEEIVVGKAPPLLLDPEERLVRLAAAGVEVTVLQHFDVVLRMTPYDRFVEMIRERTELAGFLMTPDAAFGHDREGTPATLRELGQRLDPPFEVVVVPPLELAGRPVRSQEIRADVAAGDLAAARVLLGRALAVVGSVDASRRDPRSGLELRFELPVALPPAGRYRVTVEPAWREGEPRPVGERRAAVAATAVVEADAPVPLRIRPRPGLPRERRVRVTFGSRLG